MTDVWYTKSTKVVVRKIYATPLCTIISLSYHLQNIDIESVYGVIKPSEQLNRTLKDVLILLNEELQKLAINVIKAMWFVIIVNKQN
jgi:hypothetical protein